MRRWWILGWLACWAFLPTGCSGEEEPAEGYDFASCDCGNPTLETAVGLSGEIQFVDELGKFAIYRHIPGSIDSKEIFFLCQFPAHFQINGLKVRFSGDAKEPCQIPTMGTGAQQYYDLRLTNLRLE